MRELYNTCHYISPNCIGRTKKMPIYLYKCKTCGYECEVFQKSWRDLPPSCAHGKENANIDTDYEYMERQISSTSFVLKGGSWARDNYGAKK